MNVAEGVQLKVWTCVGALMVLRDEELRISLGRRDVSGGHCEPGETPPQVLLRELEEEVGVVPTEWRLLGHYDVPAHGHDHSMTLYFYEVTGWTGTPSNLQPDEHAEVEWFTIGEACQLALPHPA